MPIKQQLFIFSFPQALGTTILHSDFMNLPTLGNQISSKWNTEFAFLWLAYFTYIMSSTFIHIVACVILLFLFGTEEYCIVCINHFLVIHASVSGHLGCLSVVLSESGSLLYKRRPSQFIFYLVQLFVSLCSTDSAHQLHSNSETTHPGI